MTNIDYSLGLEGAQEKEERALSKVFKDVQLNDSKSLNMCLGAMTTLSYQAIYLNNKIKKESIKYKKLKDNLIKILTKLNNKKLSLQEIDDKTEAIKEFYQCHGSLNALLDYAENLKKLFVQERNKQKELLSKIYGKEE